MDKFIAERAKEGVGKGDILALAAEARKDKAAGHKVIDGSIGVFLNDDKTLNGVSEIKDALRDHINDNLGYPPILGYDEYRKEVLKWLFKDKYETICKDFNIPFAATLGGTGACSIAFSTFLSEGEKVLLPLPMWSNYTLVAKKAGDGFVTYPLINEKKRFNIAGVQEQIEALAQSQKHVLVVINDPCQNPTGLCMNKEEYDAFFAMLEEEGKKTALSVLFDIAYLDYDCPLSQVHESILKVSEKKHSFLVSFAFSCSKTFGVYGLRCGALFSLTDSEEISQELLGAFGGAARGIYSCPDGPAIKTIALALSDPQKSFGLRESIAQNTKVLQKRGKYLRALLDSAKIPYFPYDNGFFLTVEAEDAYKTCQALKELHTYLVPISPKHIRIALSGLNEEEMKILVNQLKGAL